MHCEQTTPSYGFLQIGQMLSMTSHSFLLSDLGGPRLSRISTFHSGRDLGTPLEMFHRCRNINLNIPTNCHDTAPNGAWQRLEAGTIAALAVHARAFPEMLGEQYPDLRSGLIFGLKIGADK